jgi:hypothetical protein
MSQKSILTTLKKLTNFPLITHNTKVWSSLYNNIYLLKRLFFLKGVWITKSFVSSENNLTHLNFLLFYQSNKISLYKKFLLKGKIPIRNYYEIKDLLKIHRKFFSIYKTSNFLLNFKCLNAQSKKKNLVPLFLKLKSFIPTVFIRRFNLFLDFLKLTDSYLSFFIGLDTFILLLNRVFKALSKRLHTKFLFFIKDISKYFILTVRFTINFVLKIRGFKFIIAGRFNGKQRSSSKLVQKGSVPNQSFSKEVDYAATNVYTMYGAFGLKSWALKIKLNY